MTKEEIMAVVKPAIGAQLKSPASAQFPDELIKISGNDAIGYHVEGFVDSQNGYGAMIRNDFTADVSVSNGYPVVTSSSVAQKTTKSNAKSFIIIFIALSVLTSLFAWLSTIADWSIISCAMRY